MPLFNHFDVWFRPKCFESERLYARLGAPLIKRYVPTGGDLLMQRLRRHHPALGDLDLAFSQLNKATDQRFIWIERMKVDPLMDDVRTDKRYNDLLRRVYSHE